MLFSIVEGPSPLYMQFIRAHCTAEAPTQTANGEFTTYVRQICSSLSLCLSPLQTNIHNTDTHKRTVTFMFVFTNYDVRAAFFSLFASFVFVCSLLFNFHRKFCVNAFNFPIRWVLSNLFSHAVQTAKICGEFSLCGEVSKQARLFDARTKYNEHTCCILRDAKWMGVFSNNVSCYFSIWHTQEETYSRYATINNRLLLQIRNDIVAWKCRCKVSHFHIVFLL